MVANWGIPMRKFETGATRDTDANKLDFEGAMSPIALESLVAYMHRHRETSQGPRASDNWQKGMPRDEYMKSMWRHFHEAWKLHRAGVVDDRQLEDALCGVWFNVQGYLHELIKARG